MSWLEALLALNVLTMLFSSSTDDGFSEIDSEGESQRKSLGDEFVDGIFLDRFGPMLVK